MPWHQSEKMYHFALESDDGGGPHFLRTCLKDHGTIHNQKMVKSERTACVLSSSTSFPGNASPVKGHAVEIFVQVKNADIKRFGLKRLLDNFFSTSLFPPFFEAWGLIDVVFN